MAQSWYNAIQAGCAALLSSAKDSLRALQPGMDITHIGWIIEQVCARVCLVLVQFVIIYSNKACAHKVNTLAELSVCVRTGIREADPGGADRQRSVVV